MRRSLKCFVIGISCLVSGVLTFQDAAAQNVFGNAQTPMRQTREQIAALPPSTGAALSQTGFKPTTSNSLQQPQNEGQVHSSFYRQASAQSDVYPYPATAPPRTGLGSQSNYALSRNGASARLSTQMSPGSNTTTGSLGNSAYGRAPVYNLNPNAAVLNPGSANLRTSSRSLVEQQRASTLGPPRQSGLNGMASQIRTNPATGVSQPTTAYRQPTNPNTTLGLGNPQFRVAQNCNCAPGYNPVAAGYQAPAAFQAPTLNPNVGQGLGVPPLNIQVPGQPGVGPGCCQPNYQVQPGIGTPQYGAQGASWWTPFVSGSGVYNPLLKLHNLPVGTYLGQGIIGQPTAYVDGQPVRNLLRYVFP
jgi:hypothetical protein